MPPATTHGIGHCKPVVVVIIDAGPAIVFFSFVLF
jgi:hypothetical protein